MLGSVLEAHEPSQAGTCDMYLCGVELTCGNGSLLADVPDLVHVISVHKALVPRWQWHSTFGKPTLLCS